MMPISYRALFALPSLPRLIVGMTLARVVASMAPVGLVLFTLEQFGSAPFAGLVTFAATAPAVLVSPIAGALLDRHGRARLVVLAYLFGAACTAGVGAFALAGGLPEWLLVALVVLAAFTAPLANNGVRSLLPQLVPEPLWERLNAVDANAFVLALLLGPPIAGVLVQALGGASAMLVVGGLLALASLTLVGIREPLVRGATGPLLASAAEGLRYVWSNRTLRALALCVIPFYFAYGMLTIALPVIVLERFAAGPAAVGAMWGAMAVAGGVAALVFGGRSSRGRERVWLAGAMVATAAAYAALVPAVGRRRQRRTPRSCRPSACRSRSPRWPSPASPPARSTSHCSRSGSARPTRRGWGARSRCRRRSTARVRRSVQPSQVRSSPRPSMRPCSWRPPRAWSER